MNEALAETLLTPLDPKVPPEERRKEFLLGER